MSNTTRPQIVIPSDSDSHPLRANLGYRELVATLRRQIESGRLVPGDRLPSYAEMRRQGMGQATVERAYHRLEQDGLISREARRGIFVASKKREVTGRIGFLGSAFTHRKNLPYASHMVDGIERVARRENQHIVLLRNVGAVQEDSVDGILVTSYEPDDTRLLPPNVPAVALLHHAEAIPSVVSDDFNGTILGIRRLINLGHRRIAALLQSSVVSVHMRTSGYRAALAEARIPFEQGWLHESMLEMTSEGYRAWGRRSMTVWLANGWHELGCTALFVQNDMAAMGVIDALRKTDIRVPEDLSVLSFDGTEVCEYSWPTLAAVQVPLEEIAETGMELLLRMIRGEKVKPTATMLPAKWKDGDSIAPPRGFTSGKRNGAPQILKRTRT